MKILFFSYPSSFQNIGGGEILALKLREFLLARGLSVKLFDMWEDRVENFDILHVLGSVKDCLGLVQVAKARGVKVVISPLFWTSLKRALYEEGSFSEKANFLLRHMMKVLLPRFPSARRKLLLQGDILLPNAQSEIEHLNRLFAVPREKMRVLYNGVDPKFRHGDPKLFTTQYGMENFILSVGRIEPRKNQLNLIRAANKLGVPLVIVGDAVSGLEAYSEQCRSIAGKNIHFVGRIAHDSPLLASAYKACAVFVLQEWFATPGLAALEAALAGARVAVTSGGSTRDYFEKYAEYFDPKDPSDMARCIRVLLRKEKDTALQEHVDRHFTWDKIAEQCEHFYHALLDARGE